jgi:tetratricopeptide (TPR) repeat protein
MEIRIDLKSSSRRALTGLAGLLLCGSLGVVVLSTFITGVLADERVLPRVDQLESYLKFWPESPRIQAKLAAARLADPDRDLKSLEAGASQACDLSPYDYRNRMLLADIDEAAGDRQAALDAIEAAKILAPNNTEVGWRHANLLLRDGKFELAQEAFRTACANDLPLVPVTLDILWRASAANVPVLESVTPPEPESRLNLAGFLLLNSRGADASRIFSGIPRSAVLKLPNTPVFINSMIRAGESNLARHLWLDLVGADPNNAPLLWNGGFESAVRRNLSQFDWQLESSPYANIRIDSSAAHSGSRALKIEFLGRDTTKLDREITQQVVLASGATYRIQCFVKAEQFGAPEGPAIVAADPVNGQTIAASAPIATGTYDWRPVALDFTVAASATGYAAVTVSVKRKPKFSYDEPARGIVRLDDFSLTRLEPVAPERARGRSAAAGGIREERDQ